MQRRVRPLTHIGLVGGVGILMVGISTSAPAWGQFSSMEWRLDQLRQRLEVQNAAATTSGSVVLEGRPLFLVAAPAASPVEGDTSPYLPLQQRITAIETSLDRIADSDFDADTLQVTTELDEVTNQPIVKVNGEYLMTVTSLDADLQGQQPIAWAAQVSEIIRHALLTSKLERHPNFLIRQGVIAAGMLASTVVLSWGLTCWRQRIQARQQQVWIGSEALAAKRPDLAQEFGTDSESAEPAIDPAQLQKQKEELRRRGFSLDMQRRLMQVGQIMLWGSSLSIGLGLFPHTRWMQVLILVILRGPFLKLVGVGVGTYFAVRVSDVLTDNLFASLHQDRWFGLIPSHRIAKRISTLSGVVKGIAAVSLVVISGVVGLVLLGVSLGPILASLGFIGLGISLAAQDVIKDTINGLLILMEDQFAEGDVISVEDKGGVVEHMSLRITQLRNTEGNLITIPNSTIKVVENLSNGWSRVDLAILVAYDTDLDYAMRVIETTALKMSRDPKWRDPILEMPQVLGVDDFGELGITLRLWIKVQPLKQWDVAREFRRRLKLAFDQAGIVIPVPLPSVWFMNKLETAQPEVSQDPTG